MGEWLAIGEINYQRMLYSGNGNGMRQFFLVASSLSRHSASRVPERAQTGGDKFVLSHAPFPSIYISFLFRLLLLACFEFWIDRHPFGRKQSELEPGSVTSRGGGALENRKSEGLVSGLFITQ